MKPLSRILREAITEKQRFGKETGQNYDAAEQKFRPLYMQQTRESNLFVQYSDVDKLGINPKSDFKTPLGIYAYPSYMFSYDDLVNGKVPFAGERKFIIGFKAKDHSKLLVIDEGGNVSPNSGIKEAELEPMFSRLIQDMGKPQLDDILKSKKRQESAGKAFFHAIFSLAGISRQAGKKPSIEASRLFSKLGIQGVVDEGSGAIHDNEPIQAVFFNAANIEKIMTIPNKRSTKEHSRQGAFSPASVEILRKTLDYAQKNDIINDSQHLAAYRLFLRISSKFEDHDPITAQNFAAEMQDAGVDTINLEMFCRKMLASVPAMKDLGNEAKTVLKTIQRLINKL